MTFGARLRQLREQLGLSLDDLVVRTGISKAYLWKLEKKPDSNPSIEVAQKLARALDTTVADLIGESRSEPLETTIPTALQECLEKFKGQISEADIRALSAIHFRGRRPDDAEGWFSLYLQLKKLPSLDGRE